MKWYNRLAREVGRPGHMILGLLAAGAFFAAILGSMRGLPDIPAGYYGPTQSGQEYAQ